MLCVAITLLRMTATLKAFMVFKLDQSHTTIAHHVLYLNTDELSLKHMHACGVVFGYLG